MITAIAIDDEPLALELIESFCNRMDEVKLLRTFTKVSEAQKYLKKYPVDLLLLDINMPQLSGIEFYKKVEQNTMVIFTTAYSEHAIEGFNLNAIDYILKPYSFNRFELAVKKAKDYYEYIHQKSETIIKYIYVKADYSLIKILLSDIQYIEAFADYLKIYLPNKKSITARLTMKAMMDKLPSSKFIRVHRSFILPLDRIISIRNKMISIEGRDIPIGTSYEEDLSHIIKGL
jgi:DNA-binding LytR/AlgR family response regulator